MVVFPKFFGFDLLVAKALDGPDAQQAIFHLRIDLAQVMPRLLKRLFHFETERERAEQHDGQNREDDQRHGQVGIRQNRKGDADFEHGRKQLFREVVRELGNIVEVRSDAAHELANFGVVIVRIGEQLHMRKEIPAHIRLNLGAGNMPERGFIEFRQGIQQPQPQIA